MGPILFLIFINDLPDYLMCRVGTFADDTTLYSGLPKPSCFFDKVELAADLESDLRTALRSLDKIQNRLLNLVGPELFSTLQSLSHTHKLTAEP